MIAVASYSHPIPPPTEPLQYRAIGVLRGRYEPSEEQFTKGVLITHDGVQVDAVLLGRLMSLVKKKLDLSQERLWVVYPRTRNQPRAVPGEPVPDTPFLPLHVQMMGVWEPGELHPEEELTAEDIRVEEDYFSIRGEVVRQNHRAEAVTVRIRRAPMNLAGTADTFKLELKGTLPQPGKGMFWDLQVKRQGTNLLIRQAHQVAAILPNKPAARRPGPTSRPSRPTTTSGGGGGGGRPVPRPKPAPPSAGT
ncbi:hypothetical protein GlitD10_2648 [Gloeomargarita lithophora Alchichica-D10]|uniref:Uncharacterized protein n=1 Tax=Gloeomargarita lithophora Alchichica-D10 TaxID=1188229 RepID=A0A1J0AGC3_9CYAN|nr:hypothetical protein [Gloeomargarita lithophora]APB34990.1 hypothetical protein GlitD10_2648 [Gloeomargarita lithophora Alchichica-D10]